MTRAVWDRLLAEARRVHDANAALHAFCPFPNDITPQPLSPHHVPAADLFTRETGLAGSPLAGFHDALLAATPAAHWRETYKDTNIGQDFMDRFGCYCLIGDQGPFHSDHMRAWMVYMPPHLHYTWHHHLAEEAYLVIAGSARFFRHRSPEVTLSAGDTLQHQSNEPHAMETGDSPVLCYVIWRNGFDLIPVLSTAEDLA
ncbi:MULTISPECIES: dimethylsulfonioproprionate lyase family protein [unclassified Roseovarius]|uniref:dimethylsulfonioproprionate lyase family protein n=1 Tax=unclassified Roseovarius TaxID=2614913 RepID=UPI00273DF145|nr:MULTISPECIES: dimethylsulfonioproprionate lyase family protein [unclassified Roseovarius]